MVKTARPVGADVEEGAMGMIVRGRDLAAPALFHGRDAELKRLAMLEGNMRVALLYGAPGVGKSALAYVAAGRWEHRVVYQRASSGGTLRSVLDDLRAQLGRDEVLEEADQDGVDDGDRIRDVVGRLDKEQVLWVVDDLHKLSPTDRSALVGGVAANLTRGRMIATSRETVELQPTGAYWIEIELRGFDHDSSKQLWSAFDTIYGAATGFADAWKSSQGNPQELRIAHARARRDAVGGSSRLLRVEAEGRRVLFGDLAIDLASRPVLRKLWLALCRSAGQRVSKDELAQQVWGRDYNPLSDDSPLWVNVGRLRKLLSELPIAIESDDGGYRLELPAEVHIELG